MRLVAIALALLGVQAACSAFEPEGDEIEMTISATPSSSTLGDTVLIRVVGHNRSSHTVELLGNGCGNSLVARVTEPNGRVVRFWGGPAICPVFDDNILEAGETDTVSYRWVSRGAGNYLVQGGYLSEGRFHQRTQRLPFRVSPPAIP